MQTLTNCSILIITLLLAVYIGQLHVVKVWHTWGTLNLIHVLYVCELYELHWGFWHILFPLTTLLVTYLITKSGHP